jgi:hypothetical protein
MADVSASPQTLWHYTDAGGMFGIVNSRQLRFGDAQFLNDRTERRYGQVLRKSITETAAAAGDPSDVVRNIDTALDWLRADHLYLCSFSANDNESISQWQRYGADGAGYCIGFDTAELDAALSVHQVYRAPIIYDPAKQESTLRESLDVAVKTYETSTGRAPAAPETDWIFLAIASEEVGRAEKQMKSHYFHDEEEWRYFREIHKDQLTHDAPVEFHTRGQYVKPFIAFPPRHEQLPPLPITHIICGPRLDAELAIQSVTRFITFCGYTNVMVDRSKLSEIWR